MKKTRLVAGLLLVMLFTAVNCVMALAGTSKINGHLDSVEGNMYQARAIVIAVAT